MPVSNSDHHKNQQNRLITWHATIRPILENHTVNKIPTPIKVDILEKYLQGYDTNLKKKNPTYYPQGLKEGFKLEFQGERKFQQSSNQKPANVNHVLVTEKNQ